MNKSMTVIMASVCAFSVFSAASAAEEKGTLREEEPKVFEAGVDVDLNTAYVWRNIVQTDKLVLQPCAWGDFTLFDPFRFGFFYWQGWDLSSDRREVYRRRLNESDYNLHVGVTAWESEDGDMSLSFEAGHEWYTYHFTRRDENGRDLSPSTREFYLKGRFENPVITPYGQVSWLYDEIEDMGPGFYYEVGFNKEFELCDSLTFGLDWNTSMGDGGYSDFLCTGRSGFFGTTIMGYLTWQVTDWMSLVGRLAYTGLLDSDVRDDFDAGGAGDDKDLLWGGVGLKLAF